MSVNDVYLNFPSYIYVSKNFINCDSINTKKVKKLKNVLVVIECVYNTQNGKIDSCRNNNYDVYSEKEILKNVWNILMEHNMDEILNILDINPFKYSHNLAKVISDYIEMNNTEGTKFNRFTSILNELELYFSNRNKKYIVVSLQEAETLRYYIHRKYTAERISDATRGNTNRSDDNLEGEYRRGGKSMVNENLIDIFDQGKKQNGDTSHVDLLKTEIEGCIKDEIEKEEELNDGWGLNNQFSSFALDGADIPWDDSTTWVKEPEVDLFFDEMSKKKENYVADVGSNELLEVYEGEKTNKGEEVNELEAFSNVHINLYNYYFWFTPIEITDRNNIRKYMSRQTQIVYSVCKFFNSDGKFIDGHVNLLLQYLNFNPPKHRFSYFNELYMLRRIVKDKINKVYKNVEKNVHVKKSKIELEIVEKKLFEGNGDIYSFKIMQEMVRQSLKRKQLTIQDIFDHELNYICSKDDIRLLFDFLNIHDKNLVHILFDILGSHISLQELSFTLNPTHNVKKLRFQNYAHSGETKHIYTDNFLKEIDKCLKNFKFTLTDHTYFKLIWSGKICNHRILQKATVPGETSVEIASSKDITEGKGIMNILNTEKRVYPYIDDNSMTAHHKVEKDTYKWSPTNDLLNGIFGHTKSTKGEFQNMGNENVRLNTFASEHFYIYEAENTDPKDRGMMSKNKHKILFGHYASNKAIDNIFPILEMTDISINSMYTSTSAQDILNLLFPHPKKYLLLWHEDYSTKKADECLHIWKPVLSSSHFVNTTFLGFIATIGPQQPPLNRIRAFPKSIIKSIPSKKCTTFYADNSFSIDNSGALNTLSVHFFNGLDVNTYEEFLFRNFSLSIIAKMKKIKSVNEDIFNLWGDEQTQVEEEEDDDDGPTSEWEVIPQGF
ncbi:hypothetical protein POVWA1_053590 [Plasmodium ovale wallikeri]|uniref:ubiquitinyl hydrolase 1 n=2 Tax=Plasmodium ovale TaxID=36330 RepID=A0A1C3KXM1_PLAOA|nr:hypothetical protein POVWA1_053590 [Plasmodium ovale wallikeri]SBT78982.1 conserved Plasmodium protein, unknown function [Plasmodium ovale]